MQWLQRLLPLNHTEQIPRFLGSVHATKWSPAYRTDTRAYLQRWTPELGRNPSRKEIICLLDKVQTQSGARTADRVKVALSGYFSFLLDEELTLGNPTKDIRLRGNRDGRERFLSIPEIKVLWLATEPIERNPVPQDFCRIVRLLLLTGQRKTEIGSLVWTEINHDERLVSLPRERTKNRRTHEFPLSDLAVSLLPPRREGHSFVFGVRRDSGFRGWSKSKEILDAQIGGMAPWVSALGRCFDGRAAIVTRNIVASVLIGCAVAVLLGAASAFMTRRWGAPGYQGG